MNNNMLRGVLLAVLPAQAMVILIGSRLVAAGGFQEAMGCAAIILSSSIAAVVILMTYQLRKNQGNSGHKSGHNFHPPRR